MILVVSSRADEHAQAVTAELEGLGCAYQLLDLADFPQQIGLTIRYTSDAPVSGELQYRMSRTQLRTAEIRAVWWRRPQQFQLDPRIVRDSHRTFAYNECWEAIAGFWQTFDANWINDPARDQAAARKVYQLKVAQDVGLEIPKTLITSDSVDAQAFVSALGCERTVYKAFSATEAEWRETRILQRGELALLDNVVHAPVIFQEYVAGGPDLRVTVIDRHIFAAAIYSQDTSYPVDFRADMRTARVEPVALPGPVEEKLYLFMSRLGLVYGAIDMRRDAAGQYVFFEINPAGQWLFIEQRTGQPITATLARTLAKFDHESRS